MAWIAAKMRLLLETEGFDEYIRQLEVTEQAWVERTVTEGKDAYERNAGIVQGLRIAGHLPGRLIEHYQKLRERHPDEARGTR
jgi:hypothetical protein